MAAPAAEMRASAQMAAHSSGVCVDRLPVGRQLYIYSLVLGTKLRIAMPDWHSCSSSRGEVHTCPVRCTPARPSLPARPGTPSWLATCLSVVHTAAKQQPDACAARQAHCRGGRGAGVRRAALKETARGEIRIPGPPAFAALARTQSRLVPHLHSPVAIPRSHNLPLPHQPHTSAQADVPHPDPALAPALACPPTCC